MTFRIRYSLQCDECGRTSDQTSFDQRKLVHSLQERDWIEDDKGPDYRHYCPSCVRYRERAQRLEAR